MGGGRETLVDVSDGRLGRGMNGSPPPAGVLTGVARADREEADTGSAASLAAVVNDLLEDWLPSTSTPVVLVDAVSADH